MCIICSKSVKCVLISSYYSTPDDEGNLETLSWYFVVTALHHKIEINYNQEYCRAGPVHHHHQDRKYFHENLFVKHGTETWTWERSYCWWDRQNLWMKMNENKIFSGKSLSNWNMDNIAMAIMNENRNSFCKLKLNYCWIYCKWKETTDEKEATVEEIVNKHLIVETFSLFRKTFVKPKH